METAFVNASETSDKPKKNPQPKNTKFKVVSPKDKTSPQQVQKITLVHASALPDAQKACEISIHLQNGRNSTGFSISDFTPAQ